MVPSDPDGILLDYSQDKVVLLDESGTFTYANDAVEPILGFAPEELVGENAFEYIHPEDREAVRTAFERTIESDAFTEASVEYRHRTKDGSWVWLESRMSNLTDSVLDGYVVSSRDVTDRVRAEEERQRTAERLEEIAAASGDVLWMFDADWSEVLFVNPAYEEIYGRPVEELESDPESFLETVHPDDVSQVRDAMERLNAGMSVDMEYRVDAEEGQDRWVWIQAEPIIEDGEVVRITGFTRDITDRRRRERQLYVMDNLLRHNLRNDLNLILGMAELIEDDVPEAEARTAVIRRTGEALLESAEKGREIIDLLTKRGQRERLDLGNVVADARDTVHERFDRPIVETGSIEPCTVRARAELRLCVVELLENAIRHSDSETPFVRVSVRCADDGDEAVLTVEDDSAPIPSIEADVLEGNHEMNDVYHSSGLGFWLLYWCVELSGGSVSVESDPESGNTITVRLPLDEG
ncbi:PAS domain-containing sensor histidine kinase [Halobellus sp. EA9]|uniref:PAS domain-containing sensor histidine kinase n=1 Tax=Halobellus sp. EA9 TaxID=3421647 RepID=UPI003EBED6BE